MAPDECTDKSDFIDGRQESLSRLKLSNSRFVEKNFLSDCHLIPHDPLNQYIEAAVGWDELTGRK